jgi:hypothetical protein
VRPDLQIGIATAAKSGSTVTVRLDGEIITVECARDLTVAANDPVLVVRVGSKPFVIARLFPSALTTLPDILYPSPPAKPATVTGRLVVQPVDTGSHRGVLGWRTDTQIRQGVYGGFGNHTGSAFYGSKPTSLTGATVTAAQLAVRRSTGGAAGAVGTTLRLVTEATRPSGAPTLTSSTAGPSLRPGQQSTFTVPVSWAQELVNGTAGGLAIHDADGDPYVELDGRAVWPSAFTLTIDWQR